MPLKNNLSGIFTIILLSLSNQLTHNQATKAEWSIFCVDSLTGLIMAVAFVYPSRKLADVKLSSVVKRLLKEPKFAAGTRREEIKKCALPEGLNLTVEKFVEICLNSMKLIAGEIGV